MNDSAPEKFAVIGYDLGVADKAAGIPARGNLYLFDLDHIQKEVLASAEDFGLQVLLEDPDPGTCIHALRGSFGLNCVLKVIEGYKIGYGE